jgi:hypothetical protein
LVGVGEDAFQVGKEPFAGAVGFWIAGGGERPARVTGALWPIAAGEVGDRDERGPHVRSSIFDGKLGVRVLQLVEVVAHGDVEAISKCMQRWDCPFRSPLLHHLARSAAPHPDHHGPVLDRIG